MKKLNKILSVLTAALLCIAFSIGIMPLEASAFGGMQDIKNVALTFSMPPVNAADVSALNVSTTTGGCYISSVAWYDIYGERITNKFTGNNATVEIVVKSSSGRYFSSDVSVTIGGQAVSYAHYGSELHISNTYSPVIWAPTMVKHPGDETVIEGGVASFVSYSACTDKSSWQILDTEGNIYSAETFAEKYPDLVVLPSFDKLNISPVPMELDGYKVRCSFSGPGGDINSNYAKITVEPRYISTKPSVEEGGAKGDTAPAPTPAPTPAHEHVFSTELSIDMGYHWYACECGEAHAKEGHNFKWTQISIADLDSQGLVQGECEDCGYTVDAKTDLSASAREEAEKETPAQEEESLIEIEEPEHKRPGLIKRIFSFIFK